MRSSRPAVSCPGRAVSRSGSASRCGHDQGRTPGGSRPGSRRPCTPCELGADTRTLRDGAASPLVLLILLAWGFGEALLLPLVPDVLIGILALAAPDHVWVLLGAAIAGGVVGAVTAWPPLLARPMMMERILIRLPVWDGAGWQKPMR